MRSNSGRPRLESVPAHDDRQHGLVVAVFDKIVQVGQAASVGHVGEDALVATCRSPFRDEGTGLLARAEQQDRGVQFVPVPLPRPVGVEQDGTVALGDLWCSALPIRLRKMLMG